MKGLINILFAASLSIVACAKIEPYSPEGENEIVFNVFAKKPVPAVRSTFPTTGDFKATAWMLPAGSIWDADKASSVLYIDAATISYDAWNTTWRDAVTAHFWPKSGSLTFMAYAPSDIGATFSKTNGVELTGYDAMANQKDFMVADVAKDKVANQNIYGYTGVPTLFRHKLVRLSFLAKLNSQPDTDPDIRINKIRIQNIYTKGNYTNGAWPTGSLSAPDTYQSSDTPPLDLLLEVTPKRIVEPYLFVIPQHLYEAADRPAPTVFVSGTWGGYTFYRSFALKTVSEQWLIDHDITYTLSFNVKDEFIEFDADVQPWEDTDCADVQIGL